MHGHGHQQQNQIQNQQQQLRYRQGGIHVIQEQEKARKNLLNQPPAGDRPQPAASGGHAFRASFLMLVGMIIGAVIGMVGGPVGLLIGAGLGGIVGMKIGQ